MRLGIRRTSGSWSERWQGALREGTTLTAKEAAGRAEAKGPLLLRSVSPLRTGSRIGLRSLSRFHLSGSPDAVYACSFQGKIRAESRNALKCRPNWRAQVRVIGHLVQQFSRDDLPSQGGLPCSPFLRDDGQGLHKPLFIHADVYTCQNDDVYMSRSAPGCNTNLRAYRSECDSC